MTTPKTRISAFVSATAKEPIERLLDLPADIIVHPRLVVSTHSGRDIADLLGLKPTPTAGLRALMNRDDD